jgi:glycosyltransferase involved in cell wall biosynthesis
VTGAALDSAAVRRVNLLELCLSPDFGGLEIFFRDFARWLSARDGIRLHFCVRAESRLAYELAPLELPTLTFPTRGGVLPLAKARQLARYVKDQRIDAIHLHWKDDLPLVACAKRLFGASAKVVHSRHMDVPGSKHDPYHRFLYDSVDVYHAITRELAQQAKEQLPVPRDRVRQIYLGSAAGDTGSSEQRSALRARMGLADRFTVGVVGRIAEYKGQHLLVDALWQLRERGVKMQGVVAGHAMEPDYLEGLKHRVQEAGLQDDVVFLGFQQDSHVLIRTLDVLVLTTVKETFGMVLVEAMHLGVAVIGSAAGGVPEIIQDGVSGLLFESGDSTSLADAIQTLYDNGERRARLAAAGQRVAQSDFDRDRQYLKIQELFAAG